MTSFQNRRNTATTPYPFTEQGVAMLSGILNSEKAIGMNIAITEALGSNDAQLNSNNGIIENLLDEKPPKENGKTATGSDSGRDRE